MATVYILANDPHALDGLGPLTNGNNSAVISKSDTTDLNPYPKGVTVITGGNLVVLPLFALDDGNHLITYTGILAGFELPFRIRRIMSTNTTAVCATIDDA